MAQSFGRDCLAASAFASSEVPQLDSTVLTDSIIKVVVGWACEA